MAVSTNRLEDNKTHKSNIQNVDHKIDIDLVQQIPVEKGNVICQSQESFTLLYLASLEGESRLVRLLLDRGADVNQLSKNGKTPLYVASEKGHLETVKMLLDGGAEVDSVNVLKECKETCLNVACRLGHLEIVKVLLEKSGKTNRIPETVESYELLYEAVKNGRSEVVTLLLENGLRVNWINKEGETLLYTACSMGHLNVVNILLDHGINVNCSSTFGGSSLYIACLNNHFLIAKVLLERGSDSGNKDIGCYQPSVTPLYIAAKEGQVELVRLMLDKGAEVDRTVRSENGETPLHIACLKGHYEVVQHLLNKGANTSLCTDYCIDKKLLGNYQQILFTPLMLSAINGQSKVVRFLLNRCTPVNQPVEVPPLWICCKEGNYDMVKLLLEYGANPDQSKSVGSFQWTPLYIATCEGHRNIVRLLLKTGANIKNRRRNEPNIFLAAYRNGHYDIFVDLIKKCNKSDHAFCDLEQLISISFDNNHYDIVDAFVERSIAKTCIKHEPHFEVLEQHLNKLKVVGQLDDVLLADKGKLDEYHTEIKDIKLFKVYNGLSMYVVFQNFRNPYYLRNQDLLKVLEKHLSSPKTMEMFPHYSDILKNRLMSSIYRLTLLTNISEVLEGQKWWDTLPLPVKENILIYLDNYDLEEMCNY